MTFMENLMHTRHCSARVPRVKSLSFIYVDANSSVKMLRNREMVMLKVAQLKLT